MTKLDHLYAEKGKKFDEICAFLARELGYGDFAGIDPEDRKYLEYEAEQQVSEWKRPLNSARVPTYVRARRCGVSWASTSAYAKESSMNKRSRSVFGHTRKEARDVSALRFEPPKDGAPAEAGALSLESALREVVAHV